jgi:hypothetical protein
VRREIAYREIGAVIEVGRFWGNLLASQPLTFSLFGPLKQNLALATAALRPLVPDLVENVTDILHQTRRPAGHGTGGHLRPGLQEDGTRRPPQSRQRSRRSSTPIVVCGPMVPASSSMS